MTPEEIKAAREKLGLTQAEFAKAFQVSPRAIRAGSMASATGARTLSRPSSRSWSSSR